MGELTGQNHAHLCVDMQRMFAEPTDWHAPWLVRVLPAVEAITDRCAARTIFTRFIPPASPDEASGAWRTYFRRWWPITQDNLPPELLELVPSLARYVPPARQLDKQVYSPWFKPELIKALRSTGVDTLIVTGGETDVCVATTVLGAIDHGLRVVLPTDAVFGSADETHDAMLRVFQSRFSLQLVTCTTNDLLTDLAHER
ncbi:MAG TPA: isochorismatase family cysteine hydrolase [Devosia sp.]|jgi:nicotinamidase-related amidase|nr:isochorismatase family cysteine hydrolase [Devosia sp.]